MSYIWRLEWFGVALEDTRWVVQAPAIFIPQVEANFQDMYENVADESALWVITSSSWIERTKQSAEWEIQAILSANSIWYFLRNIIWTATSAETSWGWAYEHNFSDEMTNEKKSMTITKITPLWTKQYAFWMLTSLWISTKVWEQIIAKMWIKSKSGIAWSEIKAYTEDYKFYAKHLNIYEADTLAWLDSATPICLSDFELNFIQPLEEDYCLNSWVEIANLYNTDLQTEMSVTRVKRDTTFEDRAKSLSMKAMRIEIIDTSKTIWVSDHPTIIIDIAKTNIEEYETSSPLWEIVKESFKIKAHYDLANWKNIDVKVINEITSY